MSNFFIYLIFLLAKHNKSDDARKKSTCRRRNTLGLMIFCIGVAGWATGMKLGSDSSSNYQTHRNIGIALFALGTLQVFALLLRPKKDHKYRSYWNVCHYAIGYSVIVLSIVNVFKGLDILNPDRKWKKAYIGILIFLGVNAAILEAFTWYLVSKRRKSEKQQGRVPTTSDMLTERITATDDRMAEYDVIKD